MASSKKSVPTKINMDNSYREVLNNGSENIGNIERMDKLSNGTEDTVPLPEGLHGKDIMSIVMKRRLGGGSDNVDIQSPVKKPRLEDQSKNDNVDNQSPVKKPRFEDQSKNDNVNNQSPVKKPRLEDQSKNDNVNNQSSGSLNFENKGGNKHEKLTETIKHNGEYLSEEETCTDAATEANNVYSTDHSRKECVKYDDDAELSQREDNTSELPKTNQSPVNQDNGSVEPRIEMFNDESEESSSDSNFTMFTLSNFQSLNSMEDAKKDNSKHFTNIHTAENVSTKDESENKRSENLKCGSQLVLSESQESSQKNSKDNDESLLSGCLEVKAFDEIIKGSRHLCQGNDKNVVIDTSEITKAYKSMQQYWEKESTNTESEKDEPHVEVDKAPKENQETDHDQGLDEKTKLDHNCEEAVSDDKENVNRSKSENGFIPKQKEDICNKNVNTDSAKKSRKQNKPRRMAKLVVDNGEEIKETVEETIAPQSEISGVDVDNNVSEKKSKSEKSRKQFKPQRVMLDTKNIKGDNDNDVVDGDDAVHGDDTEIEKPETGVSEEEFTVEINEDCDEDNYYNYDNDPHPDTTDPHHDTTDTVTGADGDSTHGEGDMGGMYMYGNMTNILQRGYVDNTPGQDGAASDDLEVWKNSMMVAGPSLPSTEFGNIYDNQNGSIESALGMEENLDIVRKLREIRFNRYRKISLMEKKEIAEYAKCNSVSSAATYFGVSKSAVSMWTRMDFSDVTEETEKKKKNCMLGNEKYEQLVAKVRSERGNKFKGLTKQDKFEVSRYAKLVGVREMARCLNIALGTVSGWMRQFPYPLPSANQSKESNQATNENQDLSQSAVNVANDLDNLNESHSSVMGDKKDSLPKSNKIKIRIKTEKTGDETYCLSSSIVNEDLDSCNDSNVGYNDIEGCEQSNDEKDTKSSDLNKKKTCKKGKPKGQNSETKESKNSSQKKSSLDSGISNDLEAPSDEIDAMIAETLVKPNPDKRFEDIQDMIAGSALENDDFFENLFRRVIACKADKYKTLKASEKLEVVRYAKRNGVRRIAKILGLATGTLSGWTTRYQDHLGLTLNLDPALDGVNDSHIASDIQNSSVLSTDLDSTTASVNGSANTSLAADSADPFTAFLAQQSASLHKNTAAALGLDNNEEKSEVTAIKYLLKDQYQNYVQKIEIARKIKFKNISPHEKIEVVKCAKLVGIRPTARVLNVPIGTLSGWITKYSDTLHPVYHVEDTDTMDVRPDKFHLAFPLPGLINAFQNKDELAMNLSMFSEGTASPSMSWPSMVGAGSSAIEVRDAIVQQKANSDEIVVDTQSAFNEDNTDDIDMKSIGNSSGKFVVKMAFPKTSTPSKGSSTNKLQFANQKHLKGQLENKDDELACGNEELVQSSATLQYNADIDALMKVNTGTVSVDEHVDKDGFEEEAKIMAQKYLQTAYQQLGMSLN